MATTVVSCVQHRPKTAWILAASVKNEMVYKRYNIC